MRKTLPTHGYVQFKYRLVGVLLGYVRAKTIGTNEACDQLGWRPGGEERRGPDDRL